MTRYVKNLFVLIVFILICTAVNISSTFASEFEITEAVGGLSISTPTKAASEKDSDSENLLSPGEPLLPRATEPAQSIEQMARPRIGEDTNGTINFYNMGNGNAILVLINGRPPLICDAGSVAYSDIFQAVPRGEHVRRLITPMVTDITTFYTNRGVDPVNYGQGWPLSICISHPSLDHFNVIHDIVTRLRLNDPTPLNIHAMLGGHKEDYENARGPGGVPVGRRLLDTLQAERLVFVGEDDPINDDDYIHFTAQRAINNAVEIDWLLHRYDPVHGIDEPNWYGNSHITHLIGQLDLGFDLPIGGNADAHDAKSIVTRIRINEWTLLTQGDALRRNTDRIRGIIDQPALESDIYHASLQGGGVTNRLDRANRRDWIQFINPRFGVLTAGSHGRHQHPKAEVIERFYYQGNRLDAHHTQHYIHFFNPNNLLLPFPVFGPNRFGGFLGSTDRGIYATFTSGKVSFTSQNPAQPIAEYVGNNLPPYLP